ncbi:MAG: hypothetical protein N2170_09950, partial [Bacteroidia bacterium]|nr:hypothetical protein [Bacteroidia bacterium]
GSVTGASLAWAGRGTLEGILLLTAFLAAFSGAYRRLLRAWRASGIDWMLVWAILWGFFYHVILIELPLIFRLVIGGVIFWGGVLFIWYKRGFDEREIRLAVETAGLRRFLPFIQRWLNKQSPSSP